MWKSLLIIYPHRTFSTCELFLADPPKFAPSKSALPRATRKYKSLNMLALKLVKPGGLFMTCSCSGAIAQGDGLLPLVQVSPKELSFKANLNLKLHTYLKFLPWNLDIHGLTSPNPIHFAFKTRCCFYVYLSKLFLNYFTFDFFLDLSHFVTSSRR